MKKSKASFAKACLPARVMLRNMALCAILGATGSAMAQAMPVVDMYKSAQCGCCNSWADHLQKNGFTVILHDVDDVTAERKRLGMPNQFGSCHTARVGQYLVEGHVPAADIKRLLKKHPRAIGLAVPSMPPGSPGMEGAHSVSYDTLLVGKDGHPTVFARHAAAVAANY